MDNLVYWIWLSLACTPDKDTFIKLWSKYGSVTDIYNLDEASISKIIPSNNSDHKRLIDKSTEKAEEIYAFCKKHSVGILLFEDADYPTRLREIPTPPVLLYYRGTLPDFNNNYCLGIVGTRSLSDYGRQNTFKISYDIALAGAVIVSGMAIGIDGVSHAGALSANAQTVAVLGCGIDICYPKDHLKLARSIVKSGCVVTEFAPGTRPERYNFPKRNRIISGLSCAVAVMEGREKSGALLTARHAKNQGRDVYAFPGDVGNPGSQLTNLLIKNGAKLFTSADEIITYANESGYKMLNPFKLVDSKRPDIYESLSEYGISAVTPSDDIFYSTKKKRSTSNKADPVIEKQTEENTSAAYDEGKVEEAQKNVESIFDKNTLKIYKKIPIDTDCSIDSLIDDDFTVRDVMNCLFKLEMGHFITKLPGERVQRKLK